MPENRISVIIPVYNVVDYLDRCIETVVNQTYTNLEILLIDDGSTDGSEALCDAWAERDERVKAVHTPNGGAATARNVGLNMASGSYIMFVDADDYLSYDICCQLHATLETQPVDCVVCGFEIVAEDGTVKETTGVGRRLEISGVQAIQERYLCHNNAMHIVEPWGKLFRREMWSERRFTAGLYYEDLDIMPYLYTPCQRIVFIPEIGYYYYQRSESASRGTGTDDKRYTDSVAIRQKHIRYYQEIGEKALAVHMAERLADLIITSACNGWIPSACEQDSRHIFVECVGILNKDKTVSVKNKVRYGIFKRFGVKGYCKLVRRSKGEQ